MENTNNQNSQQKVIATKTVKKTKRVLVGKGVFYAIFIVTFAVAGFLMLCLDSDNFLRGFTEKTTDSAFLIGLSDFLNRFKGVTDLFIGMGLSFDIKMITWVVYFVFIALFLVVFTVLMFRKSIYKKRETKHILKKGEPFSSRRKIAFNIVYWSIAAVVAGALVGVLAGFLPSFLQKVTHNPNLNLQYFGEHILEFLRLLGTTFLLLAVFPLVCLIIWAIFKLLVFFFGLIVSGVSKSVMQSEEYQETMAASQAAAADIANTMAEAISKCTLALSKYTPGMLKNKELDPHFVGFHKRYLVWYYVMS